jgi:hypothetical protein
VCAKDSVARVTGSGGREKRVNSVYILDTELK